MSFDFSEIKSKTTINQFGSEIHPIEMAGGCAEIATSEEAESAKC